MKVRFTEDWPLYSGDADCKGMFITKGWEYNLPIELVDAPSSASAEQRLKALEERVAVLEQEVK